MRMRILLPSAVLSLICGTQAFAGQVVVSCGSGQHAVVREASLRGDSVTRVQCVSDGNYRSSTYRTRYTTERPRRSWGKSALTIAGGVGTGAGIGGIVHGKKGALIGAALGGGAASIYEGARRR